MAGSSSNEDGLSQDRNMGPPTKYRIRDYYSVIKALAKGSPHRPGLPQAVVTRICSLAQLAWAHPAISHDCRTPMIIPSRGPEERVPWFRTAPFTPEILSRVTGFQLSTFSHDQGWVDDPGAGSYTWYQIRVVNPQTHPEGKLRENGSPAIWDSHRNRVGNSTTECYRGTLFDDEHEIFTYLKAGDCLEVTANARFYGWVNYAERGSLEVFTGWEPSSRMMGLIYGTPVPPESDPEPKPKPEPEPVHAVPAQVAPVQAVPVQAAPAQAALAQARPVPAAPVPAASAQGGPASSGQPSGSNTQTAPGNEEFSARFQALRDRLKSRFG